MVAAVILLLGTGAGLLGYFLTKDSPDQSSGGPYKRVAVVTDTPQCSMIGKNILNANGSAVDAAITAMFCLGVVSMHSSGIGGGGVMLVYNQTSKQVKVIDFRETAPATAHKKMFKGNESKARKGPSFLSVVYNAFLNSFLTYNCFSWFQDYVDCSLDFTKFIDSIIFLMYAISMLWFNFILGSNLTFFRFWVL